MNGKKFILSLDKKQYFLLKQKITHMTQLHLRTVLSEI